MIKNNILIVFIFRINLIIINKIKIYSNNHSYILYKKICYKLHLI